MKKILVFLLICLSSITLFAQSAHFEIIKPEGQSGDNMFINAVIVINGEEQANTALELGVFDAATGECRGTKYPPRQLPNGRIYYAVPVFALTGDLLTYRLYDHDSEMELEYEVEFTEDYPQVAWEANATYGALRSPWNVFFVSSESTVYTRDILGYGEDNFNSTLGYYLIASPIGEVSPNNAEQVEGMIFEENPDDYDLYGFKQSEELEWQNYKANPESFTYLS